MLQIALAQINPIVGDLNFNLNSIIAYIQQAQQQQVELLLFPELALLGYPADDLLMLPDVVSQTQKALETLITFTQDIIVIIGVPRVHDHKLYNSAAIIMDQKLHGFYDKMLLPTYDVFAEARYFTPGHNCPIWNLKGHRVVVTICEDMWPCQRYNIDPLAPVSYTHLTLPTIA